MQSRDSEDSEDSGGEKGSVQSSHNDESSDWRTLEEDVDNSQGKLAEVHHVSGKLKGKELQEAVGEANVASIATGGGKAGSVAGPSK